MVFRQGMTPVVAGAVVGIGCALAGTRLLRGLVYQVAPTDPGTFVAVTGVLLVVGAAACVIPAWRATRVEPMVVLREE